MTVVEGIRREIVFRCIAARHRHAVQTTISSMNKRRLQNQKQFPAGLGIFARQQNVFKIGIQLLLVSHPKTVALRAENRLGVPAKDEPSAGLRERDVEMRCESAMDRSELLSHKRRLIDPSKAREV